MKAIVNVFRLNCRERPLGAIKSIIEEGTEVEVTEMEKNWAHLSDGTWVDSQFLQFVPEVEQKVTAAALLEEPDEVTKVSTDIHTPEYRLHRVKIRESLWDIAEDYLGDGSRYPEIKKLNNLTSDILRPSMTLKIPNK